MTKTLLCLHGWGGTGDSFAELREALKDAAIEVHSPDLPGFGNEPDPDKPWSADDYADWVESYIAKNIDGEFILLGHSHGGRIAIKLATRNKLPISQLYLCAAAGIRHAKPFRRTLGLILAKVGRVIFSIPGLNKLEPAAKKSLYKLFRAHDYERASDVMRKTFELVDKEDLRPLLSKITVPTNIFWGEGDSMTLVSDGKLMNKLIPQSTLHTFPNVRHRVHRDSANEIAEVLKRGKA